MTILDINEDGYPILAAGAHIIINRQPFGATPAGASGGDWRVYNGSNGTGLITAGVEYPVTAVTRHTLRVRVPALYNDERTSIPINRTQYDGSNDNQPLYQIVGVDGPTPRKRGVNPNTIVTLKDGDAEYSLPTIDINDPRIQWIWDDLADFAKGQNWCGQYESLAATMGIPGRPREFTVTRKLGTMTVSQKFTARSKPEAEALMDAELLALGVTKTESVSTEAVSTQNPF